MCLSAASVTRSSSAASLAFFHPLGGLMTRGSIRTASLLTIPRADTGGGFSPKAGGAREHCCGRQPAAPTLSYRAAPASPTFLRQRRPSASMRSTSSE